jgi:hypothetical protein
MCHTAVPCQHFIAKKLVCQCATISDEPVVLLDLLLTIHSLRDEKMPLLSLSSIESLPWSEEGGGDQQMPELSNEVFSKSHMTKALKTPEIIL